MNNMSFIDFEVYVAGRILGFLGDEYKDAVVEVTDVVKNNDQKYRALNIKQPGVGICPTIYLDGFYEQYKKGMELDVVMSEIARLRKEHNKQDSFDIEFVRDFEQVKDRIIPKLINIDLNKQYLVDKPFTEFADLAVVYYILLDEYKDFDGEGQMSIAVTEELFRTWNVSWSKIEKLAIKNMRKLLPSTFRGMGDVLGELLGDDVPAGISTSCFDDFICVVSNNKSVNGAMAILDTNFMNKIHNFYGKDFFVIPSSIHECLTIPVVGKFDASELRAMIREVNDTQVQRADLLSYSLYRYNPETGLQIVEDIDSQMTA